MIGADRQRDYMHEFDPLVQKFDELEREVARREMRERQAGCPHVHMDKIREMGGRSWALCIDCGMIKQLTVPRL